MTICRVALVWALGSACLWAQATSQIQGTVTDATGAAVPGAEVRVTQTNTGLSRSVNSGADGRYVFSSLPIGPYRLEVGSSGFSTYVQSGIILQVNTNPTVNVTLAVGEVSQQIQVEANATLVESQATSVGAVIENERIIQLPLNGRNPAELIQLVGAALPAGTSHTAGMPGGINISVGGGLLSGMTYMLDGTLYNNPFDAVNLPFPFPDALEEFKVETSTLTAQNGLHSAGAVAAVVKSGTNEFHGNAFEFFRNGKMNARNFFAARRDTLKRNQYGGTVGGPIVQNKLHFFAGYQGTRTRSDPGSSTAFVPTDAMLNGDFSQCSTFGAITDPTTGDPFPGNQIPVSRFSPQAMNIVEFLPQSADPCGRVTYGALDQINEYQVLGRTDYQISDRQFLFGRYMATRYLLGASYGITGNILTSTQGALDDLAQTATIGHTFLLSPTTVNTFRFAYNRVAVARVNDDYFSGCDIGVNMYCYIPHQTIVNVTGGFTIGSGTYIAASFIPSYFTASNDLSLVRGDHQITVGFAGFRYQHSQTANVYAAANFPFNGQATGLGMADFVLGRTTNFLQGAPNGLYPFKWYVGLYAQDTWKVSSRLTANLGLRWEPFLPQQVNNNAVYTFSQERFEQGVRSQGLPNAPAGFYWPNDPGFHAQSGIANRYNQFAPRVGLAYDVTGNGKTVVRTSFGISYDFPNVQIMSVSSTAPPFSAPLTLPETVDMADPFAGQPGGNPFPTQFDVNQKFNPYGTFVNQQPDAKATTVYAWNFGVQHQIGANWLVSGTYMGTQTAHLWVTRQLNPALLLGFGPCTLPATGDRVWDPCTTTANTNQRRLASVLSPEDGQYIGLNDQLDSSGTISYNALILNLQRRLSRGVTFNANYTWSHCIGDQTQASTVGIAGWGLLDPTNRAFDRGNCQSSTLQGGNNSLDRRHNLNFSFVATAPRWSDRGVLGVLASNWRLSSSLRILSGGFITATTGVDRRLEGGSGAIQRPDQIMKDPLCEDRHVGGCWINPDAFAQPALGTLGTLGRSSILGPGFWELDSALSRLFRVGETMSFELRGEAFNLTNSTRADDVTTSRNSQNFGLILSARDPRIMQLALKFAF